VSGHGDSIRERRAQETRKNGGRKAKTATTKGLAYLVAAKFNDSREQLLVLERILLGRLDREYLSWNGRTH